MKPTVQIAQTALALCLLAGCASAPSTETRQQVRAEANPADRVQRNITNFTPALRCMDELMFRLGTRDVTLMMEELRDATQKVPVSARDMLTSAVSEMTRRSRALRLSVVGSDQANLMQALQGAQKTSVFAVVPEFNVRGTISQFDEDVKKQGSTFGLLAERAFGVRFGDDSKFSVIAFDAAVVRTESLTLIPGVVSKNTTVIARRDSSAGDGQARILGVAAVFSFNAARAEGQAQAVRNMIELAAIELVGKLIRAPYWQCLGTPDDDPEIQREVDDWFFSMQGDELTVFIKERLRERRYFDGALDGTTSPAYEASLQTYRRRLNLPEQGTVDAEFFRRFVSHNVGVGPLARPASRATAAVPAAPAAVAQAPVAAPDPAPAVAATAPPPSAPIKVFARPEGDGRVQLRVVADGAGYVYCYAQDAASGAIRRIFPNRFVRDPRVEPGQAISLPGASRFSLTAAHQFACIHAPSEVYGDLPPPLRWGDFEDVRLKGFDEIRAAFAKASGQTIALAHPGQL